MICPELPDYDLSRGLPPESLFKNSPVLRFSQSWLPSPEQGFRAGEVRIGWFRNTFCFDARLEDDRIFTSAQKRNEMLYLLGDTLECFAGIDQDPAYVEYHYAPNGVILQLLWPRPLATIDLKSSGGVEAFTIFENSSRHVMERISGGWRVNAQVSLPSSGNSSGSLAGVSIDLHFGRYDYSDGESKPVLSSTSVLPRAAFHDRANWRRVLCCQTPMQ